MVVHVFMVMDLLQEFMVYHLSKKETPQNVSQSSILRLEGLIEIVKQQTATTYQDDYLNYRGIYTINHTMSQ